MRPETDYRLAYDLGVKDGDTADARARVAKHSSASVEHYTPAGIVDLARSLMGGIDLDPASCAKANEIIKAARYFTKETDGLAQEWRGSIWLNPPGGRHPDYGTASLTKIWWRKLVREWQADHVSQACFLGFNMECLQTTQSYDKRYPWPGKDLAMTDFPICIPSKRICFLYVEAGDTRFKIGGGPTHANVIVYVGHAWDRFAEVFDALGAVMMPNHLRRE